MELSPTAHGFVDLSRGAARTAFSGASCKDVCVAFSEVGLDAALEPEKTATAVYPSAMTCFALHCAKRNPGEVVNCIRAFFYITACQVYGNAAEGQDPHQRLRTLHEKIKALAHFAVMHGGAFLTGFSSALYKMSHARAEAPHGVPLLCHLPLLRDLCAAFPSAAAVVFQTLRSELPFGGAGALGLSWVLSDMYTNTPRHGCLRNAMFARLFYEALLSKYNVYVNAHMTLYEHIVETFGREGVPVQFEYLKLVAPMSNADLAFEVTLNTSAAPRTPQTPSERPAAAPPPASPVAQLGPSSEVSAQILELRDNLAAMRDKFNKLSVAFKEQAASAAAAASQRDELEDRLNCSVCFESPRSVVFVPCKHVVSCAPCAASLKNKCCPLCTMKFSHYMRFYAA